MPRTVPCCKPSMFGATSEERSPLASQSTNMRLNAGEAGDDRVPLGAAAGQHRSTRSTSPSRSRFVQSRGRRAPPAIVSLLYASAGGQNKSGIGSDPNPMTTSNAPTEPVPMNPANLSPMSAAVAGVSAMMPIAVSMLCPIKRRAVGQDQVGIGINQGVSRLLRWSRLSAQSRACRQGDKPQNE